MTKNYIEQESGRSMVEMLGVLAIIGVLSVGGISGYTTAMNKHKANEILNAAAIRAMAVATQIQNGATTPSLDEFDEDEVIGGAKFSNTPVVNGNQFTIGFTTPPSPAVLTQMENIIGDKSIVQDINETDGGLTYNKDLGTGENAPEEVDPSNCLASTHVEGYGMLNGTCVQCPYGILGSFGDEVWCVPCDINNKYALGSDGKCVFCASEYFGMGGECYCEPSETYGWNADGNCVELTTTF